MRVAGCLAKSRSSAAVGRRNSPRQVCSPLAGALAAGICALAGLCGAPSAFGESYDVPLFVSRTASGQQGVLRVLNLSDESGGVEIRAIDDSGTRSGAATLVIEALAAVDLDASDLTSGDGSKGLAEGLGALPDHVRLEVESDLRIQLLAHLRSADGASTAVHDTVRLEPVRVEGGFEHLVPVFHPASNMANVSRLRLVNPTGQPASVEIVASDDAGIAATGGDVRLVLPANGAATLTAQQLEAGDDSITGQLGAGSGSWRLRVSSDQPIRVVNLMIASTGRLDNLSTAGLAGSAPSGQEAFATRFSDASIAAESGLRRITLEIDSGGGFTEAVEEGGVTSSRAGSYAYVRVAENAGRVTLGHDDGGTCVLHLYFTSAADGWYASRCVGADGSDDQWTGGTWGVADDIGPPPAGSASPSFDAVGRPEDQTYTAGTIIDPFTLPAATGGDGSLAYSLAPTLPGLSFDATARQLVGTPTTAGTHLMTYTVTDADGDTDTLTFTINVVPSGDGAGNAEGDCSVGMLVSPGEGCAYPGTDSDFKVDADGRGSFLVITSSRAININRVTYQGTFFDFRASHQGDGVWRIDRIEGNTEDPAAPPSGGGSMPVFAAGAGPGDQAYTAGTAIDTLTLPEATGGDGTLTYGLSPDVPGLAFDATTRQLGGTPTTAGTYSMTYSATDQDGDTDTLGFTIGVAETPAMRDMLGDCYVSLLLISGQSCAHPGTDELFSVDAQGRGAFLGRLAGDRIEIDGESVDDHVYDFEASRQNDGVWRINRIAGSTETPDRAELVALYEATDGANWQRSANWLGAGPLSEWQGVEVDASGRVSALFLHQNGLSGSIPAELGGLRNLEVLWLNDNSLDGPIPPELGKLSKLENLSLQHNRLSGPVPAGVGELSSLTILYLAGNRLSESIPAELGRLSSLQNLWLSDNQLSGSIPVELGQLSSLQNLWLSDNQLNGEIPGELGGLASLQRLLLSSNRLSGSIPGELGKLTNLLGLALQDNELSGPIPAGLGGLSSLLELSLHSNQLSGPIPGELGRLPSLIDLNLYNNELSGPIPAGLGGASGLEFLRLSSNRLSGPIPPELGQLSRLTTLWLYANELSGAIPGELGGLANLRELLLGNNRLSGSIPPELGQLSRLTMLWLYANELSGTIPEALGGLDELTHILLSGNDLTGCVPSGLRDVPQNDFSMLGLPFCRESS